MLWRTSQTGGYLTFKIGTPHYHILVDVKEKIILFILLFYWLFFFLIITTKSILYHFSSKICLTVYDILLFHTYCFCNVTTEDKKIITKHIRHFFYFFPFFISFLHTVMDGAYKCYITKRSPHLSLGSCLAKWNI